MALENDIMLGETKTWICLMCARSYRYKGALENHVKKEHPEVWNVSREEVDKPVAEKSVVQEVPEPKPEPVAEVPEGIFAPTAFQEQFPFGEKWAHLNKKDRAKVEMAVSKVRPVAGLTDILNFRIDGDIVILVLANGGKYHIDISQP